MSRITSETSKATKLVQLALATAFLVIIWSLSRSLLGLTKMDERLLVAQEELEILKQENLKLQAQAQEHGSGIHDEAVIRDKLGLVKSDEAVVIIPNDITESIEQAKRSDDQQMLVSVTLPVWKQWLQLFL